MERRVSQDHWVLITALARLISMEHGVNDPHNMILALVSLEKMFVFLFICSFLLKVCYLGISIRVG